MSDSPQEENNSKISLLTSDPVSASRKGQNSGSQSDKAEHHLAAVAEPRTPAKPAESQQTDTTQPKPATTPAPEVSPSKQNHLPLFVWILGILALTALVVFALVAGYLLLNNPKQGKIPEQAEQKSDPVSILPAAPEGTTILQKQPELEVESPQTAFAPIAQGADIASGFAMDLGSAGSFQELSTRFGNIVEANGPDNFQRLEPRAVLRETLTGLEARLMVGPFDTEKEAVEACKVLILQDGQTCTATEFDGEIIPRN